jgi:hypothetical protein
MGGLVDQHPDGGRHVDGPLHQRHVAAIVEQHGRRLRDACSVQRRRARIDHRVLTAPQQQRGLGDARGFVAGEEALGAAADAVEHGLFEGGVALALRDVGHVRGPGDGRPGVFEVVDGGEVAIQARAVVHAEGILAGEHVRAEAVVVEAHACGIDQCEARDTLRISRGDQRRDTAAHRMADEHDGLVRRDGMDERSEAFALREEAVVLAREAFAFAPPGRSGITTR